MTRKDFEDIARAVYEAGYEPAVLIEAATKIANAIEVHHPNFDRAKFLYACGVEEVPDAGELLHGVEGTV